MITDSQKIKYIRTAGILALSGNALLCGAKVVAGLLSKSLSLLGDGMDSAGDVLIAIMTLVVGHIILTPSDQRHPWGHRRAETIATLFISFAICFAASQLIIQAVKKLIHGSSLIESFSLATLVSVISVAAKSLLALSQFVLGKKAGSQMLRANAENMKSDIFLSAAVLLGLILSKAFRLPVIDPVIALAVGLWVIKNGIKLFLETNLELMDGNADDSLYQKLFDAALSVKGVQNPHKARIRKMGSAYDIDLDFEVAPEMSVYDAHELTEEVEQAIRQAIPEVFDVQIHVEPLGSDSHQPREMYGIRAQ